MSALLLRMLQLLTGAYNKAADSNIGKLFSIFAQSIAQAEDALQLIRSWRDIDQAQGSTLERIGRNFGVKRDGANDAYYRLLIQIKIVSLLSGGDVNTIIEATASLFDIDVTEVSLDEIFPAKIWISINEAALTAEKREIAPMVATVLKRLAAAGVGVRMFFNAHVRQSSPLYFYSTGFVVSHVTIRPADNP